MPGHFPRGPRNTLGKKCQAGDLLDSRANRKSHATRRRPRASGSWAYGVGNGLRPNRPFQLRQVDRPRFRDPPLQHRTLAGYRVLAHSPRITRRNSANASRCNLTNSSLSILVDGLGCPMDFL